MTCHRNIFRITIWKVVNTQWQRVQQLLEEFERLPASRQLHWLESAEPDPTLRAQVLDLYAAMREEQAASAAARPVPSPAWQGPATIGEYRVLARVGTGGRSVVYQAERTVAGARQLVAIKVLLDHLFTPQDLDRFRREQGILAGLRHPGISRFLDVGMDPQGFPFLVMEWIDGQTLDRYSEPLPLPVRVDLIAQVLDAVQAAHQQLIVHLDLKPGNILVEPSGQVKLIDFGTAKLLDREGASTGTRQMTPRYASPEQLRGEPLGTASDLYSLGLTLYELIATGHHPASQSIIANLAARAFTEEIEVRHPSDPDLEAILRKALRRDPADRYRSAAEFAEDLRAWRAGRPVRAQQQTFTYRATRYLRRNRRPLALAAAMLALLATFATLAWREQAERRREVERTAATARFLSEMLNTSSTASSGNPSMTVFEMIERAHRRIESGQGPPLAVSAQIQSSFAYVAQEAGREDLALPMALAAATKADASGEASLRLAAHKVAAVILMRLGRCPDALQHFTSVDPLLPQLRGEQRAGYLEARANAYSRCESNPQAAVTAYQDALRALPSEPSFHLQRAALYNAYALELSRLRRFDDARAAVEQGLLAAEQHPDGKYFAVALRRIGGQVEAAAGRHAAALRLYEAAIARAPGVANRFELLRLQLMAALQQANLDDRLAAVRASNILQQVDASLGPARWMLHADAAEVFGRARECALAFSEYEKVDALTQGQLPRDWLGNRRLVEAECEALYDPARAATLARQAREAYGNLLHPDSLKAKRLARILSP